MRVNLFSRVLSVGYIVFSWQYIYIYFYIYTTGAVYRGRDGASSDTVIPFDVFMTLGQMPRCPENEDLLVCYDDKDRKKAS